MSFELNFEQLQKKLKRVLNPSRFRFVVILYPNTNMIDNIKNHIKDIYPQSLVTNLDLKDKSYQDISNELYKNDEGFVYIDDFEQILDNPDLYYGFNQRRDKIASHNINLICFISLYEKEKLFTKSLNVIPDLWEFKNTVLELEKDDITDNLKSIKISDSSSYSSIGGLTTEDKKIELKKLLNKLDDTSSDELKLNLLYQISRIYKDIGDFDNALNYFKLKLSIEEKSKNINTDFSISYNNISTIYLSLGNINKALEYQEKSLKLKENNLKEYDPNLATSYNNISVIYLSRENLSQAFKYQKKALRIREKVLDKNHPDLALSYNNISEIYRHKKELNKALKYQKKALYILKFNNPDLAQCYNNISIIYLEMGELNKALKYQKKSLDIRKSIFDDNHPDLAQSYNNISLIYNSMNKYEEARNYLLKSIEIFDNLSYVHPNYKMAKENLKILEKKLK